MADINVPMLNLSDVSQLPENVANMGLTQAQTGLVGEQAKQVGLQNMLTGLNLDYYKRALADYSGQQGVVPDEQTGGAPAPNGAPAAPGAPATSPSNAGGESSNGAPPPPPGALPLDAAGIQAALRNQFFVNPAGTPQQQAQIVRAAALKALNPGLLAAATSQRDNYVKSATAESQKNANTLYDLMTTVANAPSGAAMATLERVSPEAAQLIQQKLGEGGDEDAAARHYAQTVAMNAHQYTGRGVVFNKNGDGIPRDAVTQMPVTGVPHQGPTPGQWLTFANEAMKPVTLNQGTATIQEPQWKYAKAPNPQTYMLQQAARLGLIAPGGAGSNLALARARQALQQVQSSQPQGAPQPGQNPTQITSTDPVMHKALQDTSYRLQTPTYAPGQGATKGESDQEGATVEAKTNLLKDAATGTLAASQAMTYLKAAKQILDSKGQSPVTGLWAPIAHQISRVWGGVNATNYQEVAKYLSNAALQNARALYGSRMTQTEVKLQLEQMNPHTTMTDKAIRDLIDENLRNSQYTVQMARRAKLYLHAGNDPQYYYDWNEQYWPQEDVVNSQSNSNAPALSKSAAPASQPSAPVRVTSPMQAAKLPKGARFQTPDGRILVRN